MHRLLFIYK